MAERRESADDQGGLPSNLEMQEASIDDSLSLSSMHTVTTSMHSIPGQAHQAVADDYSGPVSLPQMSNEEDQKALEGINALMDRARARKAKKQRGGAQGDLGASNQSLPNNLGANNEPQSLKLQSELEQLQQSPARPPKASVVDNTPVDDVAVNPPPVPTTPKPNASQPTPDPPAATEAAQGTAAQATEAQATDAQATTAQAADAVDVNDKNEPTPSQQESLTSTTPSTRKPVAVKTQLRRLQILLTDKKWDEALAAFNSIVTDDGTAQRVDKAAVTAIGCHFAKMLMHFSKHFEACKVFQKCLGLIEEIGAENAREREVQWQVHDGLAVCYSSLDQEEKEAEHYKIAIDLLSKNPAPPERYGHMMSNLGNCYKNLARLEEGLEMLEAAKAFMTRVLDPQDNVPLTEEYQKVISSLADLYKAMGQKEKAIAEYELLERGIPGEMTTIGQAMRLVSVRKSLADLKGSEGTSPRGKQEESASEEETFETLLSSLLSLRQPGGEDASVGGLPSAGIPKLAKALGHVQHVRKAQEAQNAGDEQTASEFYLKALEDIEESGDLLDEAINRPEVLGHIHNNLGNCFQNLRKFDLAKEHLMKSLQMREKIHGEKAVVDDLATVHFNLGNLHMRMNKEDEAVPHYKKAIDIYTTLTEERSPKYYVWLARSYRQLGSAYQSLDSDNGGVKAVDAYVKARELFETKNCGRPHELQAVLNNLGNAYEGLANYEKAVETLKSSLDLVVKLLEEKPNDEELLNDKAACLNNLGIAYKSDAKYEEGRELLQQCCDLRLMLIEKFKSEKALQDYPGSLYNIANCWREEKDFDQALEHFKQAAEWYRKAGKSDQEARIAMSICYEHLGDKEKAFAVLEE